MFEVVRSVQLHSSNHSPSKHHHSHPYFNNGNITMVKSPSAMSIMPPRSPEHIKFSKISTHWDKSVTYVMKKFSPQMFVCGIVHVLVIYNYLVSIRNVQFTKLAQNPVVYFELFQTVTNSLYRIAFCVLLWTRQDNMAKVMQFSGDLASPSDKVGKRIIPFTIILCILYTSIAMACGLLGDEYASRAANDGVHMTAAAWTPSSFLHASSAKAKYSLFLSSSALPPPIIHNSTINTTSNSSISDMDVEDILFGVLGMAMSISRNLCTFHSNLFLLLVTLSLASHVKAFHTLIAPPLEQNSPLSELYVNLPVEMVLSKYRGLKDLSKLLNNNFGHLLLLYVLTSIATLATYLDSVIVEPDIFTKIRIGWTTNTFMVILTLGSNVCNQISELKTWLSKGENCLQLSLHHLVILLNELNDHPVGISGMGLFTIHYKFVTGLVSTLVTYFIIMLQFQVAVRDGD